MLTREQLRAVRKIQIRTSHLVTDLFAGQYHSVFKGRGMEFAEVRLYQPGDDVRTIDWNVTARTGVPHVKRYAEEREMTVADHFARSFETAPAIGDRLDVGGLTLVVRALDNDRVAEAALVLGDARGRASAALTKS